MAVTDLIHFAKKVTAGTADIRTLKLECFPKYVSTATQCHNVSIMHCLSRSTLPVIGIDWQFCFTNSLSVHHGSVSVVVHEGSMHSATAQSYSFAVVQ